MAQSSGFGSPRAWARLNPYGHADAWSTTLSAAVGVSIQVRDQAWSGRQAYPDELDKAIGPLTDLLWGFAAWIGFAAFLLAAILFAISYWLFRPPQREA